MKKEPIQLALNQCWQMDLILLFRKYPNLKSFRRRGILDRDDGDFNIMEEDWFVNGEPIADGDSIIFCIAHQPDHKMPRWIEGYETGIELNLPGGLVDLLFDCEAATYPGIMALCCEDTPVLFDIDITREKVLALKNEFQNLLNNTQCL